MIGIRCVTAASRSVVTRPGSAATQSFTRKALVGASLPLCLMIGLHTALARQRNGVEAARASVAPIYLIAVGWVDTFASILSRAWMASRLVSGSTLI